MPKYSLLSFNQMPEPPETILAFDIGIRNLAWCLMRGISDSEPKVQILGWQNYDLLTGTGHEAPKGKVTCSRCSAAATFQNRGPDESSRLTCLRHCPVAFPPLKDLSGGAVYKKLPPMDALRQLAATSATCSGLVPPKKSASKGGLIDFLASRHSLPLEKVKLKKAVEHELATLHDAIRTFVTENAIVFRQATQICLENQPVLKNPTMKSVQILLFATLRDILQPAPPPLKLVHAGVKGKGSKKGAAKGDAGYKSRKEASEEKVREILKGGKIAEGATWSTYFEAQAKKSDLADAVCMCWDRLGLQ